MIHYSSSPVIPNSSKYEPSGKLAGSLPVADQLYHPESIMSVPAINTANTNDKNCLNDFILVKEGATPWLHILSGFPAFI